MLSNFVSLGITGLNPFGTLDSKAPPFVKTFINSLAMSTVSSFPTTTFVRAR